MITKSFKYFIPLGIFLGLIILVRRLFNITALELVLGGVLGLFLPDLDHFIYVYFLRPQELTSQRVRQAISGGKVGEAIRLICDTHAERKSLIFHTAYFQGIFFLLAFLVITSSGNLFGRGLVLGALTHFVIDQAIELAYGRGGGVTQNVYLGQSAQVQANGGLANWFTSGMNLEKSQQKIYFYISLVATLALGLLF